ncbi:alpha/beta fold hydrolase [Marinobacterium sp. YM272]|uniref:alpha/beta fold hydrolase n=1 Tax=Marinobacterium sp. YM272 TaxID=3421654 RepID=UPI003D7F2E74
MQVKELKIQVNGRVVAAMEYGDSSSEEVVLAAHGWLDNAASFALLAPRLNAQRVISVDLPGHGLSDWRAEGDWYAIWDYVLDLYGVLHELKLQRVHLLGHSLGAGILSMLAAMAPESVVSLVMLEGLGPLSQTPESAPAQMGKALEWRKAPSRASIIYSDVERMVQARMKGRFPVGYEGAKALVLRGTRQVETGFVWSHDPRLLAPSVARLTEPEVRGFLSQIRPPVLVCLTEGGIATEESRERLRVINNLHRVELKGGHHPHLEESELDAVSDSINRFYRTIRYQQR